MKVQVKFFVPLNTQVGINAMEVDLPDGATGADLLTHLADHFAHIGPVRERFRSGRALLLVNKEFISLDTPLHDQMVIVILPTGSCCHP
ncbi:MAG: MoaD/ThiS family protein [Anaerolineae bacterium]